MFLMMCVCVIPAFTIVYTKKDAAIPERFLCKKNKMFQGQATVQIEGKTPSVTGFHFSV